MTQETIALIDSIHVDPAGTTVLNIVLAFIMFGVALGIRPSTFKEVFLKPKSVILGVVSQIVLLPMLTFLLALAMNRWISPMIALGMILVASCPGGNISNFMSSLSKANAELSVSLTAISTTLAVVMTPANFSFWGSLYLDFAGKHMAGGIPELVIPFREVFNTIVVLLGIPLALGMLCSHYLPELAKKLQKPLQVLSIVFFFAIVLIAFSSNVDAFLKCIKYIFLIVLIHNLLALGTGYLTGTVFKLPYRDRRTLTIETGIQNSGLGLILLFNPQIFDETWTNVELMGGNGGMVVITAWWGIWHVISGLTVSFLFRHSKHKH